MKNKGFTLIELVIVLLLVSILIILATPRFLNYIEYAKVTQIKHDTKVVENLILAHKVKNNGVFPKEANLKHVDRDYLKEMIEELGVDFYCREGLVNEDGCITVNNGRFDLKNKQKPALLSNFFKNSDLKGESDEPKILGNVDFDKIDYYLICDSYKKNSVRSKLDGCFLICDGGRALYTSKPIHSFFPEIPEEEIVYIRPIYEYATGTSISPPFKKLDDSLQPEVIKLRVGETIDLGAPAILDGKYILRTRRFIDPVSDSYGHKTITATKDMVNKDNTYVFRYRQYKKSEIENSVGVVISEHYAYLNKFTSYYENGVKKNMYKEFLRPAYYQDPFTPTVYKDPSSKSYTINGKTLKYVKTYYLEYDTKDYTIKEIKEMPRDLNNITNGNIYMVYFLFE